MNPREHASRAPGKSTLLHVTSDALRAPLTLIVGGSVRRQQEGTASSSRIR
jgi:hypothetical protein